jgi:signal transduction histidine kinase
MFARLILQDREIKRLSDELRRGERELSTTFGNKAIDSLCENININIEQNKEIIISAKQNETRLRTSIANISHDLRTPLTAILGYLQLMTTNPDKSPEYIAVIENRANALRGLVEAFYELSVADDDNYELPLDKIDANAIFTNCLLGSHTLFSQRGIQPIVRVPNAPVCVYGNALGFERVCQNLIQNALKYAVDTVEFRIEEQNGECLLSVENNTNDINAEDLPLLFQRFYTADKSRSGKSTGIGLYLVKTLVEKMGGRVVGTELNGNLFCITIAMRSA